MDGFAGCAVVTDRCAAVVRSVGPKGMSAEARWGAGLRLHPKGEAVVFTSQQPAYPHRQEAVVRLVRPVPPRLRFAGEKISICVGFGMVVLVVTATIVGLLLTGWVCCTNR